MIIPFRPKSVLPLPSAIEPKPKKLFEQIRDHMRSRHYSYGTEQTYLFWIKRYIFFNNKRHPKDLGAQAIKRYLTYLAVEKHVAASTQNQAFNALMFLYKEIIQVELGQLQGIPRAQQPQRLPAVLTQYEVQRILAALRDTSRLIC